MTLFEDYSLFGGFVHDGNFCCLTAINDWFLARLLFLVGRTDLNLLHDTLDSWEMIVIKRFKFGLLFVFLQNLFHLLLKFI